MKNKTLWLGAGVAALVWATYKSWNLNQSIKYFQYSLSGLKFRFKNILQPELVFSINVFNPNQVSVPVKAFFGTIRNGSSIVANFNSEGEVNIDGQRSATIDVTARVNAFGVILNLIQRNKIESLQIDGMIKTGLFDMPFQKNVAVPSLSGIGNIGKWNWKTLAAMRRAKKPKRKGKGFLFIKRRGLPLPVAGTAN